MKRIALLSDIHGNLPALEAVVADLAARGVETVLNLGDHASGPLWPRETLRFLMARDWVQLLGNHDRQVALGDPGTHGLSDAYAYAATGGAERGWLGRLPSSVRLEEGILAVHGAANEDSVYLLETVEGSRTRLAERAEIEGRLGGERAPLIACGHSHIPRCVRLEDGTVLVNPGSVGLQAFVDQAPPAHLVELGSPHARYAILEGAPGAWSLEFRLVAYDWEAASRKAASQDRADWAEALRSGYLRAFRAGAGL